MGLGNCKSEKGSNGCRDRERGGGGDLYVQRVKIRIMYKLSSYNNYNYYYYYHCCCYYHYYYYYYTALNFK
jgi:hypothetical protein